MEKTERKMKLPTIDDFFTTQAERDNIKLEKVQNISLNDIDDFPEHPFKVNIEDEMLESIKEKGVLVPAIVRKKENGKYEMISGHRRKKASEQLNLETIPCIVRDLTDDEATIIMVDSNLQREKILPSEKAFAYKMKLDAIKHQGKRTDLTSSPMGTKLSAEIVGEENGDGKTQIYRHIRLTHLIPEILQMVDNDALGINPSMALRPAVEISYLKEEEQYSLLDIMDCELCTPSTSQAMKLRKMSEDGILDVDNIEDILMEEKPNQIPRLGINMNRLNPVLPLNLKTNKEREDYVITAVTFYDKYQKKLKEKQQER